MLTQLRPDAGGRISVANNGRARRFDLQNAMRYQAEGEGHWHRWRTGNISGSEVLFHREDWTRSSAPLEMMLVPPKEIMGKRAVEGVFRGTITRSEQPGNSGGGPSAQPGFPIAGLFDRRMGGRCGVAPIPD